MSKIDDGGSAFPVPAYDDGPGFCVADPGMSLRAYYAGQALPACIMTCDPRERMDGESQAEMFARLSVESADALIAALKIGGAS